MMEPRVKGAEESEGGRPQADVYFVEVYQELRALAAAKLRQEVSGHTLQPTALVHEVYLKLADQSRAVWHDRGHFLAVAAEAVRRILVDHARRRHAAKREAPGARLSFHPDLDAATSEEVDVLALDDALSHLQKLSPRQARVVEMRFFGGMDVAQTARELGVSENTVKGDWRVARAWLQERLSQSGLP